MIQINLLPDVKRDYLKAQQTKHTVIVLASLLSIAALALVGLLFSYVRLVQPQHLSNLQNDIDDNVTRQREYPDGVEMVTVQGVLDQIGPIQDKKLITSRLFGYVINFTPKDVVYSSISYDSSTQTISLSGQTVNHEKANELANNIKSAKFTSGSDDQEEEIKPFSGLVFNSLASGEDADDGRNVSFSITFQIDTILFNQATKNGKLSVNASSRELLTPSRDKLFTETSKDSSEVLQQDIQEALQ